MVIIIDILPQVMFVPSLVSDADFLSYVKRVITHYRNDRRVVFGIGDMLPVNGSIRRVETVVRMLETLTSR